MNGRAACTLLVLVALLALPARAQGEDPASPPGDAAAKAWERAVESIRRSPMYGELHVHRQEGLVPLGADPETALHEFAVEGTGVLPIRDPDSGALLLTDDFSIVMILVPAGTCLIGAQKSDADAPNFDALADPTPERTFSDVRTRHLECPVRAVDFPPLLISKYECTEAQWRAILGLAPPGPMWPHNRLPATRVSWSDVVRTLGTFRLSLPTEEEWEYACRAGTHTPWSARVDDDGPGGFCWFRGNARGKPKPVGMRLPNPFGLYDLHGNVREWCLDTPGWHEEGEEDEADASKRPSRHVCRGGAYNSPLVETRSSARWTSSRGNETIGFRPVRVLSRRHELRPWATLRDGLRERLRNPGAKRRTRGGPGTKVEQSVQAALRWLAAHQSPNGLWEAAEFGSWCDDRPATEGPDGTGDRGCDVGVTGLALTAFLVAGYTGAGEHRFDDCVRRGLAMLVSFQDRDGRFGSDDRPSRPPDHGVETREKVDGQWRSKWILVPGSGSIYCHATATLAMVEAYGLTGDLRWAASAHRALDFIAGARNDAGWGYGSGEGGSNTSVTGWMLMVLATARMITETEVAAGESPRLTVDPACLDSARTWFAGATNPKCARTGYLHRGGRCARPAYDFRFPADRSEATTSIGLLARSFLGVDPRRCPVAKKGTARCLFRIPHWDPSDGSIDMIYWHFGSLALHQRGRTQWTKWRRAVEDTLVGNQRMDTTPCLYRGSWDPIGPWGAVGGRVYSTALNALTLSTPTRYPKTYLRPRAWLER